jgi:hypothetical protein
MTAPPPKQEKEEIKVFISNRNSNCDEGMKVLVGKPGLPWSGT